MSSAANAVSKVAASNAGDWVAYWVPERAVRLGRAAKIESCGRPSLLLISYALVRSAANAARAPTSRAP